jgi:succinate-semialdehyde dehydrogenase
MSANEQIAILVENARRAQAVFEAYSQEKVDEAVRAVGKAVYDNAAPLAVAAVEETKMGNVADKTVKNAAKPKTTWYKLKGIKSRGILRAIEEEGLVEVAKPKGVVGAVTPVTNPVMTPVHNAMIALKGGNAIIISPHPRGKICGKQTVDLMREALAAIGAPQDLIQIVENPTEESSRLVMEMTDVCISTGGPGMVKVAYSSGKPAYGVGAGNVQCLVDADADFDDAVKKITTGRRYDNGVLCTCEQSAFLPAAKADGIIARFEKAGGCYYSRPADVEALRNALFPGGVIAKELVGASPGRIAEAAGLSAPDDASLLIVKLEKTGKDELLAKEKLFPVLAVYSYDTWEEAVRGAAENIDMEGTGHSVVIHSFTKHNIEYAALNINVSRFSVNQIGSSSLGGSLVNGLNPTATLGCGSWGRNSLSENLWFHHLINISRIAYEIPGAVAPTDEEIWN